MTLKEWIDSSGKSIEDVANALGCSKMDIYRYCAGEVIPRPDRMQKIVELTGGEVTPNDFYK